MSNRDELIAVFALAMLPKTEWLREDSGTPQQRSAVWACLTQEVRKLCDGFGSQDLRPMVSRRAAAAAAELNVDLCSQTWASQRAFDPQRSTFHLEHVVPVVAARTAILDCTNADQIIRVLSGLRLAWILKDENASLERLGYRSRRPDPDAAYRHAEIELIACPCV